MTKVERKISNGYGGLIEVSVIYDETTKEIVGVKAKDEAKKELKPTVKVKTDKEVDKQEIEGKQIKLKEKYYMVIDKEFGDLVTPPKFEVELNIPFA